MWRPGLVSLLFAVPSLAGCSEETSTGQELVDLAPPTLTLVAPTDGSCVAIGSDVSARVPLTFEVSNLTMRPPGACAGTTRCGRIALRADGLPNNEGASTVVDLLLRKLPNPYRDGELHAGTGQPNLLPIEAVLVDDGGTPWMDPLGGSLSIEFGLAIRPSCP